MQKIVDFIKETFKTNEFIPLHEPRFIGNEKKYLNDCIDSTFVSSVGKYVDTFEKEFAKTVGSKYAIATVNGTAALHISLLLADVKKDDEVITQPLTFIATCNAISYIGAKPIFVDVDLDTMGLSPKILKDFLEQNCEIIENKCVNKTTGKTIKACVPMHTFGHPCKIDEIKEICDIWHISLVEDAAESLGSYYKDKHTGTFGKVGAFSFNGNKIITSGGGGVIVTDDEVLAKRAKHITTTAKIPHPYEYVHDEIGYNYRLPNINAALLVAQLEQLDKFLASKRELAIKYKEFFTTNNINFIAEPKDSKSNYWLQAVLLNDVNQRNEFLEFTNKNGVMTIKHHFSKIQTMDDINFLRLIGPYMLGRVKFEEIVDIKDDLKLEDILNSSKQNLFDELLERFAIRSGVSGVQPKILLKAHNKTTMKFEHYIVKSWEDNYSNLALNEYFCMKACSYANLPTPKFYISDDFKMFIMERFDILENNYLGFEDMCVLTARGTEQKYDGSYEEIVRVIKDVISPQNRKESLKIFFKALIMNHLLKNGDGHLKNYGILYKNDFEDSYLAPIYDVITTKIYIKNDIPALRLSDGKLWWKEKTYKTFAKQSCGLSNVEYEIILEECKEAIIKTKKEIEEFMVKNQNEKFFLEDLINCWEEELK